MPQTIVKTHPTDADGNPVKFWDWAQANLTGDNLATYIAADQAYMDAIDAAGITWDRRDGRSVEITFPDTEEAFWASTPERTTILNNLNVFITQYKSDASLNW